MIKSGVTRIVFISKNRVYKIPNIKSYRQFLNGLLANMNEVSWWRDSSQDMKNLLCPVKWYFPFGLLVVMSRAEELKPPIIDDNEIFDNLIENNLPYDPNPENFGKYKGKIVCIDYGS